MRETSSIDSSMIFGSVPAARSRYPSKMPITRSPLLIASIVADAITPLMPGAGPPPTRIAKVSLMRASWETRARHLRPRYSVRNVDEESDIWPSFSIAMACCCQRTVFPKSPAAHTARPRQSRSGMSQGGGTLDCSNARRTA